MYSSVCLVFTSHEIKNGANLNATKRCNFMLLRKTEKKTKHSDAFRRDFGH